MKAFEPWWSLWDLSRGVIWLVGGPRVEHGDCLPPTVGCPALRGTIQCPRPKPWKTGTLQSFHVLPLSKPRPETAASAIDGSRAEGLPACLFRVSTLGCLGHKPEESVSTWACGPAGPPVLSCALCPILHCPSSACWLWPPVSRERGQPLVYRQSFLGLTDTVSSPSAPPGGAGAAGLRLWHPASVNVSWLYVLCWGCRTPGAQAWLTPGPSDAHCLHRCLRDGGRASGQHWWGRHLHLCMAEAALPLLPLRPCDPQSVEHRGRGSRRAEAELVSSGRPGPGWGGAWRFPFPKAVLLHGGGLEADPPWCPRRLPAAPQPLPGKVRASLASGSAMSCTGCPGGHLPPYVLLF